MIEPWSPEYRFEPDDAARAVEANTDLSPSTCLKIGEGWDFFCFLIDDQWVFRFPKRRAEVERLVAEREFLDRLELSVAVPRFCFWIAEPRDFHLPFAGYAYLAGSPLDRCTPTDIDRPSLALEVGQALAELHAQVLTPPCPPSDPVEPWIAEWHRDDVAASMPADLLDLCERALLSYSSVTRPEAPVTTHSDLGLEHIIIGAEGGLAAIIDWADACSSDRYVDFVGLWALGGDRMVEDALARYPREPDEADWTRVRTLGLAYALGQIAYGSKIDDMDLVAAASRWLTERAESNEIDRLLR